MVTILALNQRAVVYRRAGWRGGKPSYSQAGEAVRCRVQARDAREAVHGGVEGRGEAVIISENVDVAAGDRIQLPEGELMTVRAVRVVRGYDRVHHLEIDAAREG